MPGKRKITATVRASVTFNTEMIDDADSGVFGVAVVPKVKFHTPKLTQEGIKEVIEEIKKDIRNKNRKIIARV